MAVRFLPQIHVRGDRRRLNANGCLILRFRRKQHMRRRKNNVRSVKVELNSLNCAIWVCRCKTVDGGEQFFALAVKSRNAVSEANLVHFDELAIVQLHNRISMETTIVVRRTIRRIRRRNVCRIRRRNIRRIRRRNVCRIRRRLKNWMTRCCGHNRRR